MEHSKLMTPLFYGSSFNREGHKMRAVFEREISNGTETYRLWRRCGKADIEYPRAENDNYLLHAEINGYLVPLGLTDFTLIAQCGYKAAERKLYGGMKERGQHFTSLRKSGGEAAVLAALEAERVEMEQYGNDPAVQTSYIQEMLSERVSTYLKAKENGGKTFPDFYGAAVVNDLARCAELAAIYWAARKEKDAALAAQAAEEEKAFCEEQNRQAEQAISEALRIIRSGGVLKNDKIRIYRGKYDSMTYSIVSYLMRKYNVDVPLRTRGWINEILSNAIIEDGKCKRFMYLRSKNGRGSDRFFQCMNDLIRAVSAQGSEKTGKDEAA